ncbi:hypothetical protein ES702_04961 [subsurface metagenome]
MRDIEGLESYRSFTLDLDLAVARVDVPYYVGVSNALLVRQIDDINSLLSIKFDARQKESIILNNGDTFNFQDFANKREISFKRVYITNIATGGSARLIFTNNIYVHKLHRTTVNLINEGLLQQVVTVGAVATLIPAVPLANRIDILIRNPAGANTVFIGSVTVTAAGATQGMPIVAGASLSIPVADVVPVYGIVAAGTEDVNILEGA